VLLQQLVAVVAVAQCFRAEHLAALDPAAAVELLVRAEPEVLAARVLQGLEVPLQHRAVVAQPRAILWLGHYAYFDVILMGAAVARLQPPRLVAATAVSVAVAVAH
jgi:hypothetical protein